ncbi:MAG: hypothetical protein KAT05_00950 [Spirochaetes bacterium]|nr:hypothetical protein [Spirochaetota bacterium]
MLDLDNQDLDDIIIDINKLIKKNRPIKVKKENIIYENGYFKITNCSLVRSIINFEDKFLCNFSMFVFNPTLEKVTGIDDLDSYEIKRQKILEFLENEDNIPNI